MYHRENDNELSAKRPESFLSDRTRTHHPSHKNVEHHEDAGKLLRLFNFKGRRETAYFGS